MAANAGAIRAGRAFVELFGDDSKLVRVLNGASKKVKAFGTGLMAMGGKMMAGGMAIAAPLAMAVKQFSDYGSQLNDMAARTGVSVEALSELGYAAQMSGSDLESVETGIRKMQKALGSADGTSKAVAATLKSISLNASDLASMSPENQFMAIAEKLDAIDDPGRKAAATMELLGKSGTALIPMMTDLAKTREEAQRLGITMSTTQAEAADKLGDTLDTLWASIKGVGVQIGSALAPMVTGLAASATELIGKIISWVRENNALIVTAAKIVMWVIAGGAALIALGGIIYGVGTAIGILTSVTGFLGTAFTVVTATIGFIGSALGAILSPLGLLVAGLIGLGAYFVSTGDAGTWIGNILSWLGDSFGWLKDTALKAWNAISNAIASGDIGAAMNVAWTTIKMLWASGISWLYQKWAAFKGWFLQVWNEAVYGTAMMMTDAWAGMQRTWVAVVASMKLVWSEFTAWAGNLWNSMQQGVGSVFISALQKVGILSADEAKNAKDEMNKSLESTKTERSKSAADYQKQISDDAAKQKSAITKNQAETNKALTEDMLAKDKKRQDAIDADVAASKAAAEAAKAEWDKAVGGAAIEAAAEMPGGPGKPKPFAGSDVTGKMKSSVTSTFNAFALSGLGVGGNAQEETAKNTREFARLAKKWDWHGIPSSIKAT